MITSYYLLSNSTDNDHFLLLIIQFYRQ